MNLTECEFDFLEYVAGVRREFKCDDQTRISLRKFLGDLGLIAGFPSAITKRGREVLAGRAVSLAPVGFS
jgi:hypothetical protein